MSSDWDRLTQRELLEIHDRMTTWQTRERRVDEEMDGPGRAFISISERPSFSQGFNWDIRLFQGGYGLYRSASNPRRLGFLMPGFKEMAIDQPTLKSHVMSLISTRVAHWIPGVPHMGLDGTTYVLAMGSGFSHVRFTWWEEGPPEWRELTEQVRRLLGNFKQLGEAPDPPQIDPRRLVLFRRLSFEARGDGVHVGVLPLWLRQRPDVRFVIAVQCVDMNEAVRQQLASRLTIASVEDIAGLVARKQPGIAYRRALEADDDPPMSPETARFELDRSAGPLLASPRLDGATAVHVGEGLPPVKIEMWARRP